MLFRSGAVDINTIPSALIDRVEVLTGGASAVYGSDAMSGVVNFISRRDFDGLAVTTNYDVSDRGDGDTYSINVSGGVEFAGGRGRVSGFVDVYDRERIGSADRAHSRVPLGADWVTGELGPDGSIATPRGLVQIPAVFDGQFGPVTFNADGSPRIANFPDDLYNYAEFSDLQTQLERTSARVTVDFELSDNLSLRADILASNSEDTRVLAPPPYFDFVAVNLDNPLLNEQTRDLFAAN